MDLIYKRGLYPTPDNDAGAATLREMIANVHAMLPFTDIQAKRFAQIRAEELRARIAACVDAEADLESETDECVATLRALNNERLSRESAIGLDIFELLDPATKNASKANQGEA